MGDEVILISQPVAHLEKRISAYINFLARWPWDALLTIACVLAFRVVWFQLWAKWFQCIVYIFRYKALKWSLGLEKGTEGKGIFSNSQIPVGVRPLKISYMKHNVSSERTIWDSAFTCSPFTVNTAGVGAMKMGTVCPVKKGGDEVAITHMKVVML